MQDRNYLQRFCIRTIDNQPGPGGERLSLAHRQGPGESVRSRILGKESDLVSNHTLGLFRHFLARFSPQIGISDFDIHGSLLTLHILQWYRSPTLTPLIAIFVVLFGLALGSFLNVCISRLPRHESIVRPRSRCPRCGAPIGSLDNIPILSWIFLRSRCRACRQPIAWRYPAVEFATAALFLLSFLCFGLSFKGAGMDALCFLLLGLAAMDAETMRLPDAFTLPGVLFGFVYAALRPEDTLRDHLWNAAASILLAIGAALFLLLIRWLYSLVRHQEGLGMGDVKLIAMIAAWLGPLPTGLTLLLGALATALFGILAVALSRGKRPFLTTRLPLGSFLCAAAIYTIFAGDPILRWYLHFYGITY
jgi:leader peptidase (prepilin peptidase)/N-methyltransferase